MPLLIDYKETETYQEGKLEGRLEGRLEGKLEGRLEGKLEGRLEGRLEGKLETAKALLQLGELSVEKIRQVTGLTSQQIQELIKGSK
jgi:predicted transposase YdaD